MHEFKLLNEKIILQLHRLEERTPGFWAHQLDSLQQRWSEYVSGATSQYRKDGCSGAAEVVHKIKGHVGMLGFQLLSDCCGALETSLRNDDVSQSHLQNELASLSSLYEESRAELKIFLSQRPQTSAGDAGPL